MIKNRSFMIGIGVGIIAGAVLLQLVNIGKGQTMLNGMQLTPEQIQQAAQAQNMQVYSSDEQVYSRDQWQELQKQEAAKKAEAQKQTETTEPTSTDPEAPTSPEQPDTSSSNSTSSTTAPEQPKSSSTSSTTNPKQPQSSSTASTTNTEQPTSTSASSNNTQSEAATTQPAKSATPSTVQFNISSGEMLSDVAYNLKKQGLIDSQRDFVNRASQMNANKHLQIGDFQINAGESYDNIINVITGQPSS